MSQDLNQALADLHASIRLAETLADEAKAGFENAVPILKNALAHDSGQSQRVATIIQSLWNGELGENLCGLDTILANALVAAIAARAYLGGDADDLLAPLVKK